MLWVVKRKVNNMAVRSAPVWLSYPAVREEPLFINEPNRTVVIDGNLTSTRSIKISTGNLVVLGNITTPHLFSVLVSGEGFICGQLNVPMRNISLLGKVTIGMDAKDIDRIKELGVDAIHV